MIVSAVRYTKHKYVGLRLVCFKVIYNLSHISGIPTIVYDCILHHIYAVLQYYKVVFSFGSKLTKFKTIY